MLQEECINLAVEQPMVNKMHQDHVFTVVNLGTWPQHAGVRTWIVTIVEKKDM